MTDSRTGRAPLGLPAEITRALISLWTRYAGEPPGGARTDVRGNLVTCVLADAVGAFDGQIRASQTAGSVAETGQSMSVAYERDAVAAVARVTHQRVRSFVSSHDADSDVATETFSLEPSLNRGRPRLPARKSSIDPGMPGRARQAGRDRR